MSQLATVRELPILFAGSMVSAIIDDRKTQTRRLVKLRKGQEIEHGAVFSAKDPFRMVWPYGQVGDRLWVRESFYQSGNRYRTYPEDDEFRGWSGTRDVFYAADGRPEVRGQNVWGVAPGARDPESKFIPDQGGRFWRKFPSIHMPRWASRLLLEVTDVRIEKLQQITDEDAIAEGIEPNWSLYELENWDQKEHGWMSYCSHYPDGCDCFPAMTPRESFQGLWDYVNGPGSWDADPLVWAVSFKRVEGVK